MIDDDRDILALAEVALSELGGLTAVLCQSAEDALARIDEIQPDAILLDLFLPGLDGLGTLETLRANPNIRDVPVVILTAQLHSTGLAALKALQISGVIKKPLNPETLADKLRELCM